MRLIRPDAPSAPPAVPQPSAYEVRIRKAPGAMVVLVGHDGRGEPVAEFRCLRSRVSPRLIARMAAWCRENETGADLEMIR